MSRDRLLVCLEEAEAALDGSRTRIARRKLRDLRALIVVLVPAQPELCPECEIGGGRHVEGCSYATGATQ